MKKKVLKKFRKIHRKTPVPESFNKVAGLSPESCIFIREETLTQVFSCEFCEIFKNSFLTEHLQVTASVI